MQLVHVEHRSVSLCDRYKKEYALYTRYPPGFLASLINRNRSEGRQGFIRAPAAAGDGESESEVTQSCPTLCDPMDCSLPGSSLHGILQARVLEWVAISFSRGSS